MGSTYAVLAEPVLNVPYGDPLKVDQRILWTGHYEAFGRPDTLRPVCPGSFSNPIQYTGYYSDGDIFEHYYAKARYYDPYTGRFLGRDPADFDPESIPGGVNRYTYAANNPLRYVDPDGKFFLTALLGFTLEALLFDTAMFAIAGGVSEILYSNDATIGDFFRGILYGGLSGMFTSALSGLTVGGMNMISDGIMDSFLTRPFMHWYTKISAFSSSISNAWLVGKYPSNYNDIGRLAFPWTDHHGSSGWGAYFRMLGVGLGLDTSIDLSWIPSTILLIGSTAEYDDFTQHVVLQTIDEGLHSPMHAAWSWLTGKGWNWRD